MDGFEVYLLERINSLKVQLDNNKESSSVVYYNTNCIEELFDILIAYREKYKVWGSQWYEEN